MPIQKRAILNSPKLAEIKNKKRQAFKKKIVLILILLLILLTGFVFLMRLPALQIKEINVSGNKIVDTEFILSVAQSEMAGYYLFVLPKSNIFIYPEERIKQKLYDNYKRLSEITVELKGGERLMISVDEHSGIFTWCGEMLPEDGVKLEEVKCYFMNNAGYVFDEAPYFSGDVYFRFFGPLSSSEGVFLGSNFMPEIFSKLVYFYDTVRQSSLLPAFLVVGNDQEAFLYLSSNLPYSASPRILFKTNADFVKMAENFNSALTTEALATQLREKYSLFKYIDLRFNNKVYFKFE